MEFTSSHEERHSDPATLSNPKLSKNPAAGRSQAMQQQQQVVNTMLQQLPQEQRSQIEQAPSPRDAGSSVNENNGLVSVENKVWHWFRFGSTKKHIPESSMCFSRHA